MVDLEKRAKAWDTYAGEPRVFTIGDAFNFAYEAGVRDGAASVDRRAIVEEAFEKVKDWTLFKSTDATKAGTQLVGEAMDAVLAEMEVKNANS